MVLGAIRRSIGLGGLSTAAAPSPSSSSSSSPADEGVGGVGGASQRGHAGGEGRCVAPARLYGYLLLEDHKGRVKERFPMLKRTTAMGRGSDNDVRLIVHSVSRAHCRIEFDGSQCKPFLHVLGAKGATLNGTALFPDTDDEPCVSPGVAPMRSGDLLGMGRRFFRLECVAAAAAVTAHGADDAGALGAPQKLSETALLPASPAPSPRSSATAAATTVLGGRGAHDDRDDDDDVGVGGGGGRGGATRARGSVGGGGRRRLRLSLISAANVHTPAKPSRCPRMSTLPHGPAGSAAGGGHDVATSGEAANEPGGESHAATSRIDDVREEDGPGARDGDGDDDLVIVEDVEDEDGDAGTDGAGADALEAGGDRSMSSPQRGDQATMLVPYGTSREEATEELLRGREGFDPAADGKPSPSQSTLGGGATSPGRPTPKKGRRSSLFSLASINLGFYNDAPARKPDDEPSAQDPSGADSPRQGGASEPRAPPTSHEPTTPRPRKPRAVLLAPATTPSTNRRGGYAAGSAMTLPRSATTTTYASIHGLLAQPPPPSSPSAPRAQAEVLMPDTRATVDSHGTPRLPRSLSSPSRLNSPYKRDFSLRTQTLLKSCEEYLEKEVRGLNLVRSPPPSPGSAAAAGGGGGGGDAVGARPAAAAGTAWRVAPMVMGMFGRTEARVEEEAAKDHPPTTLVPPSMAGVVVAEEDTPEDDEDEDAVDRSLGLAEDVAPEAESTNDRSAAAGDDAREANLARRQLQPIAHILERPKRAGRVSLPATVVSSGGGGDVGGDHDGDDDAGWAPTKAAETSSPPPSHASDARARLGLSPRKPKRKSLGQGARLIGFHGGPSPRKSQEWARRFLVADTEPPRPTGEEDGDEVQASGEASPSANQDCSAHDVASDERHGPGEDDREEMQDELREMGEALEGLFEVQEEAGTDDEEEDGDVGGRDPGTQAELASSAGKGEGGDDGGGAPPDSPNRQETSEPQPTVTDDRDEQTPDAPLARASNGATPAAPRCGTLRDLIGKSPVHVALLQPTTTPADAAASVPPATPTGEHDSGEAQRDPPPPPPPPPPSSSIPPGPKSRRASPDDRAAARTPAQRRTAEAPTNATVSASKRGRRTPRTPLTPRAAAEAAGAHRVIGTPAAPDGAPVDVEAGTRSVRTRGEEERPEAAEAVGTSEAAESPRAEGESLAPPVTEAMAEGAGRVAVKTPRKTTELASGRTPAEAPRKTEAKTPAKTPAKMPTKTHAKTPAGTPARTAAKKLAETPARTPAKTPATTLERTPAKAPAKTPARTPARTSRGRVSTLAVRTPAPPAAPTAAADAPPTGSETTATRRSTKKKQSGTDEDGVVVQRGAPSKGTRPDPSSAPAVTMGLEQVTRSARSDAASSSASASASASPSVPKPEERITRSEATDERASPRQDSAERPPSDAEGDSDGLRAHRADDAVSRLEEVGGTGRHDAVGHRADAPAVGGSGDAEDEAGHECVGVPARAATPSSDPPQSSDALEKHGRTDEVTVDRPKRTRATRATRKASKAVEERPSPPPAQPAGGTPAGRPRGADVGGERSDGGAQSKTRGRGRGGARAAKAKAADAISETIKTGAAPLGDSVLPAPLAEIQGAEARQGQQEEDGSAAARSDGGHRGADGGEGQPAGSEGNPPTKAAKRATRSTRKAAVGDNSPPATAAPSSKSTHAPQPKSSSRRLTKPSAARSEGVAVIDAENVAPSSDDAPSSSLAYSSPAAKRAARTTRSKRPPRQL